MQPPAQAPESMCCTDCKICVVQINVFSMSCSHTRSMLPLSLQIKKRGRSSYKGSVQEGMGRRVSEVEGHYFCWFCSFPSCKAVCGTGNSDCISQAGSRVFTTHHSGWDAVMFHCFCFSLRPGRDLLLRVCMQDFPSRCLQLLKQKKITRGKKIELANKMFPRCRIQRQPGTGRFMDPKINLLPALACCKKLPALACCKILDRSQAGTVVFPPGK